MSLDWKLMLKEQQDDLARMERLDAAMNMDQHDLDEDISSILKKPAGANLRNFPRDDDEDEYYPSRPSSATATRQGGHTKYSRRDEDEDPRHSPIATSRSHVMSPGKESPEKTTLKGAPDTNARIQKARLKGLTKQLEDSKEIRKQLQDQVNDMQKQLKTERDENKLLKKRISILEADQRRGHTPKGGRGRAEQDTQNEVTELHKEIAQLKKELQTAQRLAKQAESQSKTKDTHLKRAMETINRNKAQLDQFSAQLKGSDSGDKAKLDEALARVRMLEKHREELVEGFKKQMKLIDVLKRQKTHMEAARLLQFTEEEFVKTLDWAV